MQTGKTIIQDSQAAMDYDNQAKATDWFGSDVVFGLAYEFVMPGESILDVGIGSGLSSISFHKIGLRVYGLDGSSEILKVCAAKNFTVELKQHDLCQTPLPYSSGCFNHIVSVAVLNSFEDLGPLFAEFTRIMQGGGILAFTVENQKPGQPDRYPINRVEVSEQAREGLAVMLYRHSSATIAQLLEQNSFVSLKELEFVAFKYPAEDRDVLFKAYIARKKEQ